MNLQYTPFNVLRTGFSFGTKLTVTTDKKLLSKEYRDKGMLGASVKFLKLLGNQVSIKYMGNNHYLPIEAVTSYKEFTVASKAIVSDTLFMVVAKHTLFEVGTVFEVSLLRDGNRLGFYNDCGQLCIIDDSIVSLSEPVKSNKASADLEMLSNKFSVKPKQSKKQVEIAVQKVATVVQAQPEIVSIEDLATVQASPVQTEVKSSDISLMKDVPTVPKSVFTDFVDVDTSAFDCINKTIDEEVEQTIGEFADINGFVHKTLLKCLKSNQLIIDMLYLNKVKDTLNTEIQSRR